MQTVILSGIFIGLVYGLFAVGLTVVYRGTRAINFAHGNTGMLAAFAFAELWTDRGLPLLVALLLAVALGTVVGAVTERLMARPLAQAPRSSVMIATVALASLLLVLASRRWGFRPKYIAPLVGGEGLLVGGLRIQTTQLLILVIALTILGLLLALYRYTSFGLRLRAVALDSWAAGQVGINTSATSMATWAMAGFLAALSAILIAPLVAFDVFFMTAFLIRGLAAALLGGLTSITGAFVAGIVLGVTESGIRYSISVAGADEVVMALIILAVVVIRPSGVVRAAY